MSRHEAFADQPPKARKWYRRAFQAGSNAASLYDLGIARGLLLALKRDEIIDKSTLDRMFKSILATLDSDFIEQLAPEDVARLGKGVLAPASLRTRRKRKARAAA